MPDIRTEGGKLLVTERLAEKWEPMFCSDCGGRLGWFDNGFGDEPVGLCDDCAADSTEEE